MKNNLMIMALAATLLTGNVWKKVNCKLSFYEDGSARCGSYYNEQWGAGENDKRAKLWDIIAN
jgi:hypothetical protein